MTGSGPRAVTIIGGGASGVLLAVHLLRRGDPDLHVILIERQGNFGQGLAYSALNRNHLVNVPARGMSALPEQPLHFWNWLRARGHDEASAGWVFVPRRLYGAYLAELLAQAARDSGGRLLAVSSEVLALREARSNLDVLLADGRTLHSQSVVRLSVTRPNRREAAASPYEPGRSRTHRSTPRRG